MVEALVGSIRDGPIGEERGERPLARREERPVALDVEKRLLLAGEACIRQVLRGRAAPDRHADRLRGVSAQAVVGLGDDLLKVCREARSEDSLAHLASPFATLTPAPANSRTISPREAFLPPTRGISVIPISSNQRIYGWLLAII